MGRGEVFRRVEKLRFRAENAAISTHKTRRFGERRGAFLGSGEDRFRRRCGAAGCDREKIFVIFVESLLFCAVCIFRGIFRAEIEIF